jgi:hypothetical protein
MRIAGRENERAEFWQIEPDREFPPDRAPALAGPSSRDHLDASYMVGVRCVEERVERLICPLYRAAVEIEGSRGEKFPGAQGCSPTANPDSVVR